MASQSVPAMPPPNSHSPFEQHPTERNFSDDVFVDIQCPAEDMGSLHKMTPSRRTTSATDLYSALNPISRLAGKDSGHTLIANIFSIFFARIFHAPCDPAINRHGLRFSCADTPDHAPPHVSCPSSACNKYCIGTANQHAAAFIFLALHNVAWSLVAPGSRSL